MRRDPAKPKEPPHGPPFALYRRSDPEITAGINVPEEASL
jgi:hypothetical protein